MLNGWPFDWASMATRDRESLEARGVESLPVVYIPRVYAASNRGARRKSPCLIRG